MTEARKLTITEVEQCKQCYVLYEVEDPEVHLFDRVATYDDWIKFDREFRPFVRSQPCLWKKYYGTGWVAYESYPSEKQIHRQKQRMKDNGYPSDEWYEQKKKLKQKRSYWI